MNRHEESHFFKGGEREAPFFQRGKDTIYAVKEIFYTLQGEGARTGRPAVFCRFSGCNLWSGQESERAEAICRFCDTDFFGADAGNFDNSVTLAEAIRRAWPFSEGNGKPYVVFTGGEPLLQVDEALCHDVHQHGFEIAVETNGTLPCPPLIDWICVSPKAGAGLVQKSGNELKLVFPQEGASPEKYCSLAFDNFFLQPMDSPDRKTNMDAATQYCLANPVWRLSLQTHKITGLR